MDTLQKCSPLGPASPAVRSAIAIADITQDHDQVSRSHFTCGGNGGRSSLVDPCSRFYLQWIGWKK